MCTCMSGHGANFCAIRAVAKQIFAPHGQSKILCACISSHGAIFYAIQPVTKQIFAPHGRSKIMCTCMSGRGANFLHRTASRKANFCAIQPVTKQILRRTAGPKLCALAYPVTKQIFAPYGRSKLYALAYPVITGGVEIFYFQLSDTPHHRRGTCTAGPRTVLLYSCIDRIHWNHIIYVHCIHSVDHIIYYSVIVVCERPRCKLRLSRRFLRNY